MEGNKSNFTLEKAIELAKSTHLGQVDLGGTARINHPMFVMNMLKTNDEKIAGILHDVVEDSDMTFEDLERMGCPEHILDALKLVTHPKNWNHTELEYILGIQNIVNSGNKIAVNVKYADLIHNSDLTRIPNPGDADYIRLEKYKKSLAILRPFASDYLKTIPTKI